MGEQVCESCHEEREYGDIRDLHGDGSRAICVSCIDKAFKVVDAALENPRACNYEVREALRIIIAMAKRNKQN